MSTNRYPNLGKGIYSISEAAQLVRITPARISRWIGGYNRDGIEYAPLWHSELENDSGEILLISFADLMEARVIAAFYRHGVRIQTVRIAIEQAKLEFGIERPFATEKFSTDGKRIFVDLKDVVEADSGFMDIVTSQRSFRSIVQPTLKDVDFEDDTAVRWWPLGNKKSVVVDPARSLGKPIDVNSGVPVEALVGALGIEEGEEPANDDFSNVAKLFDVSLGSVRDAARFYDKFAA